MVTHPPAENPASGNAPGKGAHVEASALGRRFGPHIALENISL